MDKETKRQVPVRFRIETTTKQQLGNLAEQEGITFDNLIRRIIYSYMDDDAEKHYERR